MSLWFEIRQNSTGEVRRYLDEFSSSDDGSWHWQWGGGNYGCDCNRARFFARAGGRPDLERECGEEAYDVLSVTQPNGTIVLAGDPRSTELPTPPGEG